MTSTQRLIISIAAGVLYFVITAMAGWKATGAQIVLVITITAAITRRFRRERKEEDE